MYHLILVSYVRCTWIENIEWPPSTGRSSWRLSEPTTTSNSIHTHPYKQLQVKVFSIWESFTNGEKLVSGLLVTDKQQNQWIHNCRSKLIVHQNTGAITWKQLMLTSCISFSDNLYIGLRMHLHLIAYIILFIYLCELSTYRGTIINVIYFYFR